MTDYSKLLNPEQLEAATAPDGSLLILAAAGTGKTRTLVYRVSYLVEKGVPARDILLLTFTNKAAREMLERSSAVIGSHANDVWGGTFHHVACLLLRRHARLVGYDTGFNIIDDSDQKSIMGQAYKEDGIAPKEFIKRDALLSLYSGARNRGVTPADFMEKSAEAAGVDLDRMLKLCEMYEARKRQMNAMDFDDLLINGLRLLREHPDVRSFYGDRFQHVLVDEYQDTNILQSDFVEMIAEQRGNLSVVGDDFQCIYTWRGADFRNIMEFPKRHPDARIVKLERNYRSRPGILEVANACIAGNPNQFQKTLRPTRPAVPYKPQLIIVNTGDDQASRVASIIREYLGGGGQRRDIAVLYRAHFHSIETQLALRRARIDFVTTSGPGVFETAHAKDLISFFKIAENPTDWISFDRVAEMLKGVGPMAVRKAWQKIGHRFDIRDAESRKAAMEAMPPKARDQWEIIDKLFEEYVKAEAERGRPDPILFTDDLISRFYTGYATAKYESPVDRLNDIRELAMIISRSADIRSFLSEVALLTNLDVVHPNDDSHDRVTLSSVHQAKGLEWPMVIILWAVEGMFPSSRAMEDSDEPSENGSAGDAEERRLFYVAATRAKDYLYIVSPRWRQTRDGGVYPCTPSRFVSEIPEHLLDVIRPAPRQSNFF